jgi:Zn finger protein HypA/HybF involved in hydrogenase expression
MHEMGVALEICRIAEQHVGTSDARFLTSVGLIVGDEAGVERSSLEFCLETLLAQPPFAGASVHITAQAGDALRVDYLEVDDARPGH